MDLWAVPQNKLVPSAVYTGSMAQGYQPELVRVHAVRMADGKVTEDTAVCGFRYRTADLGDVPWDWAGVHPSVRCADCARTFGEAIGVER